MATAEWLRTFVAVYRAGSVTEGARRRHLSQPAASQQLASLERRVGQPLFERVPGGVVPSAGGHQLYGEVAGALDSLEGVLEGLEGGRRSARAGSPVRIGTSADLFSLALLPALAPLSRPITARFGPDADLVADLAKGELDVAVTGAVSGRRGVALSPVGARRYQLVGPPGAEAPPTGATAAEVGAWLVDRPWVAFSSELPATRRFWQSVLGRPFSAPLRLVAPDLRGVLRAVELGLGHSLLPEYACAASVADGRVRALAVPGPPTALDPWFVGTRSGESRRDVLAVAEQVGSALG